MKCIIIEDEIPAQNILLKYIEMTPGISCHDVFESTHNLSLSTLNEIDFIFLNIQLPEISGIEFLKNLDYKPNVIITTAYRNYAIEAFEEAVVDYLLKPFSYIRFKKAVFRVINHKYSASKTPNMNEEIFVYSNKTYYHIKKSNIIFFKAEVDYVNIILQNDKILINDSLSNWVKKLSMYGFVQVHRSFLVNINNIDKVSGNEIFIKNYRIPIGNSYKKYFLKIIKNFI